MEHSSKASDISEFILACACPGTLEFAASAFSTIFPDTPHPVMLVGGRQILDEAERHQGDPLGEILRGISKNKEKFAYYVRLKDGSPELWDLRKGIRIP